MRTTSELIKIFHEQIPDPFHLEKGNVEYCKAILISLSDSALQYMCSRLKEEENLYSLTDYCGWLLRKRRGQVRPKPRSLEESPDFDRPIHTLLGWYLDKRSKKVSLARPILQARWRLQDRSVKIKIIEGFLSAGKADRLWALAELRKHWVPAVAGKVAESWERYHEPSATELVVKWLPDEYVLAHLPEIVETAEYFRLCIRFAGDARFQIEWDRFSYLQQLFLKARLGMEVDPARVKQDLYDWIYKEAQRQNMMWTSEVARVKWALGKFGMTDEVVNFHNFMEAVHRETEEEFDVRHEEDPEVWPNYAGAVLHLLGPGGLARTELQLE